ncbi:hypothetical protein DFO83_103125 [Idiomarina loihiensis]|uniref:hypothetical protein n=1 Tax=Idiomarina TaxID=135575 RepID=UPI000D71B464|nr:hypothetical protein [Idiomarina]PWW39217.1 hypothetical protein DFO83_103125 [Idiomarina loihiensis]TDP49688.1 hypothetical protein DET58_103274 [Idiomarina loihiensis]TDS23998.1 hypothetical protein DET62_103125 [Idiomarina sp. H2]
MLTLKLSPNSPTELAAHVVPEFQSFTLLVNSETADITVDDRARLEFQCPDIEGQPLYLEVTVVFCFEVWELKNWLAVTVLPSQQAMIHRLRYLCRHHTSEYGKLFHQLVNDFCHSNQR